MNTVMRFVALFVVLLVGCGDDGGGAAAPEPGEPGSATVVLDGERFDDLTVECEGQVALAGQGLEVVVVLATIDSDSTIEITTPDGDELTAVGGASDDIEQLESINGVGTASADADGTRIEMAWVCP